jgi:hypothetical protein
MKKLLLLTGILGVLGVPWASADVEVDIINGAASTGWIVCASPLTVCSTGTVTVGNYQVASNIGIQTDGSNPFLDLSYDANTSSNTPGSITFEVIATGYTTPLTGTYIMGSGNGTVGGTSSINSYGGNTNADCSAASCTPSSAGLTLLNTIGGLNTDNFVATVGGGAGNTVNPYSLGLVLTLNSPTSHGGASGDIQLDGVPEPASIMLLGGVLLFTGSRLRRRSKVS